jgi:diguanylate cyclase (GGDEF)-like protein
MSANDLCITDLVDLDEVHQLLTTLHAATALPYALIDDDGTPLAQSGGYADAPGHGSDASDRRLPIVIDGRRVGELALRTTDGRGETCLGLLGNIANMLADSGLARLRMHQAEAAAAGAELALQARVAERTRALDDHNRQLRDELAERNGIERTLRESEVRFRSILDHAPIGIALISLDGCFIEANRALCDLVGYPPERLLGMSFQQITHPDDLARDLANVELLIKGELASYRTEKRYLRSDGKTVWIQLSASLLRDAGGEPLHFIAQIEDINERVKSAERIKHLAYYDSLTGLPNRRLLADRLRQALAQAKRHARSLAVMYLDLDNFKHINDTLGHDIGDELLKEVAARIEHCIRGADTACRLGGDEFIVVLSEMRSSADAAAVAQKVLNALRKPIHAGNCTLHVSASIGIALFPSAGIAEAKELMKRADAAMYAAKRAGRNRYRIADEWGASEAGGRDDWLETSSPEPFRAAH